MAGRVAYYGGIVKDGLILDLDAAKKDSYPRVGTTWNDISGNANNGTLVNGPTFDSGNGGSLVFNGTSNYVNCGNQSSLDIVNFTLSAWVNSTTTTNQVVMGKTHTISYYMNMGLNNFGLFTAGSSIASTSLSINDGKWHHIVATMSGIQRSLYSDGFFNNSGTGTPPAIDANSLFIGRSATVQIPFNGNISQAQIYNRALSAAEVLQNFNATKNRYGL